MKNKLGVIFAVSVMALAGIGISYAGFTDTITVHGSVTTATVTHTIGSTFSGTWVYKVYGTGAPTHEIYVDHTGLGITEVQRLYPTAIVLGPIASATAAPGTGYDVELTWTNIFPCIDFCCDFDFTYTGTIPVKVNSMTMTYDPNPGGTPSGWIDQYLTYTLTTGTGTTPVPIGLGSQLHPGDVVHCVFCIHLPQLDSLQGKCAVGHASLQLVQWNEFPYTPIP